MLLHHRQELDCDLGARPDQGLSLSSSFGISESVKSIIKSTDANHGAGREGVGPEVSIFSAVESCCFFSQDFPMFFYCVFFDRGILSTSGFLFIPLIANGMLYSVFLSHPVAVPQDI